MNKVYLIGNLTRDPETRNTTSGIPVCNFSIAVNRRFLDAQGQRGVDYFNIVAWRQLAELCQNYLAKGRKVAVVGSIQTRTYEAQDGSKRNAFDIIADEVEFLSPNPNNAQAQTTAAPALPHTNTPGARATFSNTVVAGPAQMMTAPNYDAGMPPVDPGFTQVDDDELPF